jgi:hypothetical protein
VRTAFVAVLEASVGPPQLLSRLNRGVGSFDVQSLPTAASEPLIEVEVAPPEVD